MRRVEDNFTLQEIEMPKDKYLQIDKDINGPKDEIELLREITWLSPTDLPCPAGINSCVTINCLFNAVFKRMAEGERVPARQSMKYELLRLGTFRNALSPRFDIPHFILFASAGFYFGDGKVICYLCCLCTKIDCWNKTKDPSIVHRAYSPYCDFFSNNNNVNVPIPPLPPEYMVKFKKLDDLLETNGHAVEDVPRVDRIPQSNPQYPQYSTVSARITTFEGWPTLKRQTPQMMAESGLFYSGYGDEVRCFHCGKGLRAWEPDDKPAVEHFKWYPDCTFVNQLLLEEWTETLPKPALPSLESRMTGSAERRAVPSPQSSPWPPRQTPIPSQPVQNPGSAERRAVPSPQSSPLPQRQTPIPSQPVQNLETRETYQYHTASDLGNSSSDEDIFYDAIDHFGPGPGEDTCSSSEEECTFYDASKEIIDEAYEENQPGTSCGAEAVRPASRNNNVKSDSTSRKKKPSRNTEEEIKSKTRRLQNPQSACKVCLDRSVSIQFLPCRHLTCSECAPFLTKCPVCKATIKGKVKAIQRP